MRLPQLFLTIFCVIALNGCKNAGNNTTCLSSINIVDRNGFSETISNEDRLKQYEDVDFLKQQPYQKVLRIYGRNAQGEIKAFVTSYHPNGHPKQYLEITNNRAYGPYREWHPNGVLKLETFIIGGTADIDTAAEKTWLFNGCSRAWSEKGNLIADVSYVDGTLEGISSYYHANGNVWKLEPCHNGKIEGTYYTYLENGTLFQTAQYVAGLKTGPAIRYWSDGLISANELYNDGYLTDGQYFDLCGKQICCIENGEGFRAIFSKTCVSELHEYHKGMQEGEVKIFGNNGILISSHHVKNNLKHGEEIEYFPPEHDGCALQPMLAVQWFEGKIQGIVKTWYPNGTLESKREMINNKKNGLLSGWYPDGSLMLVEEYDQGKLVRGDYFTVGERFPISQVASGKGLATLFDEKGNVAQKIIYNNGKPLIQ
jgi:antitoxin component YwqK of YwqJK toxin-antitoxin module